MTLKMAAYEPPDFYEFEVSPDMHVPTMPPSNVSGIHSPIVILPQNPGDDHQSPIEHLKTALMAAAVLSFIFLIAKDAHKAFTRRAHWIPCDFLVLSAFSIQMLNMLNTQNQAMATSSQMARWLSIKAETGGNAAQYARWKDFLMIHNSRTILCVFTAYVMPSMADRGLEHSWVRWAALVITVFHHVTSEFYSVKDKSKENSQVPNVIRIWPSPSGKRDTVYYVFATIISLCFILLILLLACATIAGRSIERLVAQQIPLVLRGEEELRGTAEKSADQEEVHSHHPLHHHSCWRNVKIAVNRTGDHHYHLHHVHNHSCLQTVEEAVMRAGKVEYENHHHSCWRTVEDKVQRVEKEEEGTSHHSCWQRIEEAAARGEKEEEQYRRHCHYCWRRVEAAVLKAWIIVRAYSVQPVLARSALSASAAVIVTIQIVITIVGGLSKVLKKDNKGENNTFKLVALVVQSIFILMAWALINLRWAVAVAYHRRDEWDSWLSGLKMEDFWTRHLRELQQGEDSSLEEEKSLDKEIDQLVTAKKASTVPSVLLSLAIGLQWLLVSFSKACWLVSLMIFHNRLMTKLFTFLFEKQILCVFENYPKYKKILEEVQMLGESPESLWVSNRKSIEEAKRLSVQGNQDGECNCEDLVEFLINKRTPKSLGLSCLDPHKPNPDLKFLCKKKPTPWITQPPQDKRDVERQQSQGRGKDPFHEEEQFSDDGTKSSKMAAVSLLGIIVHLSTFNVKVVKEERSSSAEVGKEECSIWDAFPPEEVKNCLNVYSQAWEVIDFVEEAEEDTKADRVTSEAADKYFQALKKVMDKTAFSHENSSRHATPKDVRDALDDLKKKATELQHLNPLKKGKKQGVPNRSCKGNDSIDWKAVASGRAVYNLCDSIVCIDRTEVIDLRKEIENCLADIINECLQKTQNLLLLNSRKWALKRDEKRIGKALYTTGKAKAIMEKLACNKLAIVSYH